MENKITICSCLGPYRNMTTFTGALVALHPNCQVVNHSGKRFFNNDNVNFFRSSDEKVIDNFVNWAVDNSTNFSYGSGGPIQRSHAFSGKNKVLVDKYRKRYGHKLLKNDVRAIFWKESYKLSLYIKRHTVDLTSLPVNIKFMTPIRNPMDCAYSISSLPQQVKNHKLKTNDPVVIVRFILEELKWFFDLKTKDKDRFYYYFQDQFTEQKLVKLSKFLGVPVDPIWVADCLSAYNVQSTYKKSPKMLSAYRKIVHELFSGRIKEHLLRFTR